MGPSYQEVVVVIKYDLLVWADNFFKKNPSWLSKKLYNCQDSKMRARPLTLALYFKAEGIQQLLAEGRKKFPDEEMLFRESEDNYLYFEKNKNPGLKTENRRK